MRERRHRRLGRRLEQILWIGSKFYFPEQTVGCLHLTVPFRTDGIVRHR